MNYLQHLKAQALLKAQDKGVDISTPVENFVSGVKDFATGVVDGVENWWLKNTGRAHLTPEYQYQVHLANTAKQREAADMVAAGLSKYGGVGSASSPTPQAGNGLLATALQMQNLASGMQDLKERAWNYGVSKGLGIRTNDKNPLSQISAIFKLLTGKDLADYSDGDGVVGAIRDWWNGLSFNKGKGSKNYDYDGSDNPSNVLASASTDGVQNLLTSLQHRDTYDRSRIPLDATVSKYEMPLGSFEKAFQTIALNGMSVDSRGVHSFNGYGQSVLKGLSLLYHESYDNVVSSFKKWYSNTERRSSNPITNGVNRKKYLDKRSTYSVRYEDVPKAGGKFYAW